MNPRSGSGKKKALHPLIFPIVSCFACDLFEAEFIQGQQEHSVLLDVTGTIRMIKQDIAATELPAAIAQVLEKNYAAYTLDDSERIEKEGEVFYQVELEKGIREQHLVFGANGQENTQLPYWD